MAPTGSSCLVCDGSIDETSKDVFKTGMLGLQPLKERLQVVLQLTLDEESCHSKLLCSHCTAILDNIDEYQCNVDSFYETFQETIKKITSPETSSSDRCLTCYNKPPDSEDYQVINEDTASPNIKARLEEILTVPLDQYITQCPSICLTCVKNLEKIEAELQVIWNFTGSYRKTQESRQVEDGEGSSKKVGSTNGLVKLPRKTRFRASYVNNDPQVVVGDEGLDDINNLIEKTNTGLRCLVCGYANLRMCHMRTHIRLHTGAKPYKCQGCHRAFTDRSNCNKHVRKCAILLKQEMKNQARGGRVRPTRLSTRTESKGSSIESGVVEMEVDDFQLQCSVSGREILKADPDEQPAPSLEDGFTGYGIKEDAYSCSECGLSFPSAQAANKHILEHSTATSKPKNQMENTIKDIAGSKQNSTEPINDKIMNEIGSIVNRFMDYNSKNPDEPPVKRKRGRLPRPKCLSDSLVRENGYNYECTVCHYTSSLPHVLTHARKHTGEKPYACKYCDKRYADASNFIRHENKHESEMNTEGVVAEPLQVEPRHLRESSPIILDSASGSEEESKRTDTNSVKTFPFECSLCNSAFHDSSALTEHIRQHMEEQNRQEHEAGSKEQNGHLIHQSEKRGISEPDSSNCMDLATALSQGESGLRRSKRISSGSRVSMSMLSPDASDHDTDAMSQAYSESYDMSLDDDDPTAVSQEVRDALIMWDESRSVYKCAKCSYNNYVLYNLRKHIRTHTGEKPFKCEFCHRRFADKSNQRKHERKHHLDGDIPLAKIQAPTVTLEPKPFQCDICHVSFRYEGTLKKHRDLHDDKKGYVCQKPGCGKKFFSLFDLQRHESLQCRKLDSNTLAIVSDGEAEEEEEAGAIIRCEECGIIFAVTRDLERHKMKEHGVAPAGPTTPKPDSQRQAEERSSSGNSSSNDMLSSGQSAEVASVPEVYKRSFLTIEQLDSSTYQCLICSHTSNQFTDIITHQSRRHLKTEMQHCEDFVQYTLMDFLVELGAGQFQCKLCTYQSDIMIQIRAHLREVHDAKVHPLSCKVTGDDVHKNKIMRKDPLSVYYECLFCFARHKAPKMLARHCKNKHPEEYSRAMLPPEMSQVNLKIAEMSQANLNISEMSQVDLKISDVRTVPVEQPELASSKKSIPISQNNTSTVGSMRSNGTRMNIDSLNIKSPRETITDSNHVPVPNPPPPQDKFLRGKFTCHLCNKIFPEPGDLQIHFGEHCLGQVYPFTVALSNEVKYQGFTKFFPCLLCGATYLNTSSLEKHMATHRSELNEVVPISQSPSGPVGVHSSNQFLFGADPRLLGPQSAMLRPRLSGPLSPPGLQLSGLFNPLNPGMAPPRPPLQELVMMNAAQPPIVGAPPSPRMPTFAGFKCPLCFLTFTQPQDLMAHVDSQHKHSGSQQLPDKSNMRMQHPHSIPQPPHNQPAIAAPHHEPRNVIKIEPIPCEPGPAGTGNGAGSMKLPITIEEDPKGIPPVRPGFTRAEPTPTMKDVLVYQPFKQERKSSYDAFKLEQGISHPRLPRSPGKSTPSLMSDFQVFNRPRLPVTNPDLGLQSPVKEPKPIEITPMVSSAMFDGPGHSPLQANPSAKERNNWIETSPFGGLMDQRSKSDDIIVQLLTEREKPSSLKIIQSVGGAEGLWNKPSESDVSKDSCSSTLSEMAKKLALRNAIVNRVKNSQVSSEQSRQSMDNDFHSSSLGLHTQTSMEIHVANTSVSKPDALISPLNQALDENAGTPKGNSAEKVAYQCVDLSSEDEDIQGKDPGSEEPETQRDTSGGGKEHGYIAALRTVLNSMYGKEDQSKTQDSSTSAEAQNLSNPSIETLSHSHEKRDSCGMLAQSPQEPIERKRLLIDKDRARELVKAVKGCTSVFTTSDKNNEGNPTSISESTNPISDQGTSVTDVTSSGTQSVHGATSSSVRADPLQTESNALNGKFGETFNSPVTLDTSFGRSTSTMDSVSTYQPVEVPSAPSEKDKEDDDCVITKSNEVPVCIQDGESNSSGPTADNDVDPSSNKRKLQETTQDCPTQEVHNYSRGIDGNNAEPSTGDAVNPQGNFTTGQESPMEVVEGSSAGSTASGASSREAPENLLGGNDECSGKNNGSEITDAASGRSPGLQLETGVQEMHLVISGITGSSDGNCVPLCGSVSREMEEEEDSSECLLLNTKDSHVTGEGNLPQNCSPGLSVSPDKDACLETAEPINQNVSNEKDQSGSVLTNTLLDDEDVHAREGLSLMDTREEEDLLISKRTEDEQTVSRSTRTLAESECNSKGEESHGNSSNLAERKEEVTPRLPDNGRFSLLGIISATIDESFSQGVESENETSLQKHEEAPMEVESTAVLASGSNDEAMPDLTLTSVEENQAPGVNKKESDLEMNSVNPRLLRFNSTKEEENLCKNLTSDISTDNLDVDEQFLSKSGSSNELLMNNRTEKTENANKLSDKGLGVVDMDHDMSTVDVILESNCKTVSTSAGNHNTETDFPIQTVPSVGYENNLNDISNDSSDKSNLYSPSVVMQGDCSVVLPNSFKIQNPKVKETSEKDLENAGKPEGRDCSHDEMHQEDESAKAAKYFRKNGEELNVKEQREEEIMNLPQSVCEENTAVQTKNLFSDHESLLVTDSCENSTLLRTGEPSQRIEEPSQMTEKLSQMTQEPSQSTPKPSLITDDSLQRIEESSQRTEEISERTANPVLRTSPNDEVHEQFPGGSRIVAEDLPEAVMLGEDSLQKMHIKNLELSSKERDKSEIVISPSIGGVEECPPKPEEPAGNGAVLNVVNCVGDSTSVVHDLANPGPGQANSEDVNAQDITSEPIPGAKSQKTDITNDSLTYKIPGTDAAQSQPSGSDDDNGGSVLSSSSSTNLSVSQTQNSGVSSPESKINVPSKSVVIATCTLCGEEFSSKIGYLQHLQNHAKFTCPSCSASFHDIALLYRHFDEEH